MSAAITEDIVVTACEQCGLDVYDGGRYCLFCVRNRALCAELDALADWFDRVCGVLRTEAA